MFIFHERVQKVYHEHFSVVYTMKLSWITYFIKCCERNISQCILTFRDANQLVLNRKRFSYFLRFTHDTITQNNTHGNFMYLYRAHSVSTSLGKGEEKATKSDIDGGRAIKKVMSLTQILLWTFFCNSIFIPSWLLIKPW